MNTDTPEILMLSLFDTYRTLESVFRQHYPGFRPANDEHAAKTVAA